MIWLFVLSGVLVLLLVCLRFPAVSSWLARPLGLLGMACMIAAKACMTACINLVAWPWHRQGDQSLLGVFIARMVYLVLAGTLLLGEFPRMRLLTATLWGLSIPPLPIPIDLSICAALLWLLVPMAFFLTLGECLEKLPHEARLFGSLTKRERIVGGVISTLCIVIYLVIVIASAIFGQCMVSKLVCADDGSLQLMISGGFMGLLVIAALNAGWAFVLGLAALVAFGFGIVYCVLSIVQLTLGLTSDSVSGLRSSYRPSPGVLPFAHVVQSSPSPYAVSGATSYPQLTSGSHPPTEMETLMNDTKRINGVVGIGSHGYHLVPEFLETAHETGMNGTVLVASITDLDRVYRNDQPLKLIEGIDLSPKDEAIKAAIADESLQPAYTKLTRDTNEAIVAAFKNKHGGNILFIVDIDKLHLVYDPIRNLKNRLPNQQVVLFLVLPPYDQRDHIVPDLEVYTETAKADKIVALVIDPFARLAITVGEITEEKIAALTLLSLCNAVLHDERNPAFADVLKRMAISSPFTGLSCAILPTSPGKIHPLSHVAGWFNPNAPQKGTGDLNDLIYQAKEATDKAVTDPACRATSVPVDTSKPFYVLYNVPLMPTDKKRWNEFSTAMHRHLKLTYNGTALGIMVHANPPRSPDMKQEYRCSATVLYPLPVETLVPLQSVVSSLGATSQDNLSEQAEGLAPLAVGEAGETPSFGVRANGRRSRTGPATV